MQYLLLMMVGMMVNFFVSFVKLGFTIFVELTKVIIKLISLIFSKNNK